MVRRPADGLSRPRCRPAIRAIYPMSSGGGRWTTAAGTRISVTVQPRVRSGTLGRLIHDVKDRALLRQLSHQHSEQIANKMSDVKAYTTISRSVGALTLTGSPWYNLVNGGKDRRG